MVYFRYADAQSTPPLDINKGGVDNVFNPYGSLVNGTATVHFMRPINTTDFRDVNITSHRNIYFARGTVAYNDFLYMHDFLTTTEIYFHNSKLIILNFTTFELTL